MALLERVTTLLRANINDLLTKAEDPEKLARQLILDMENQLIQVKTQVAIAIAYQHSLKQKKTEQDEAIAVWQRRAEAAVAKGQDDLGRAALERVLSHQRMAEGLAQQYSDQTAEADALRSAYSRLQQKLQDTQHAFEILVAQLRRNRAVQRATHAHGALLEASRPAKLAALKAKVDETASAGHAARSMLTLATPETLEEGFANNEQTEKIDALLLELKERQKRLN